MATNEYASVNGLAMYYEIHGVGRPLVLLHGGVMTIDLSFGGLLPVLSATRRVIAVELQGHGRTADIDRPIRIDLLAEDVIGLLDILAIDRADVFGFSLGGYVATQLAIAHPGRVGRAVLASVSFRPDGYHDDVVDPALFAASTRMPTADDFAMMQADYARLAPEPSHFDEFRQKVGAAVTSFAGWSAEEISSISAPTMVLLGDHDFVRLEHAIELHHLIAGSQLAVLPGTKHMQVTTQVETVAPIIDRFYR